MQLHALCYYRSKSEEWTDAWKSGDYTAMKVVKAVKGLEFRGRCEIKMGEKSFTFTDNAQGRGLAMELAGRGLAKKIVDAGFKEAAVVPVPSSEHVDPNAPFTGRALAEAIQAAYGGFQARPVLYFDQPIPKARDGGPRRPEAIQPHLRTTGLNFSEPIVLLDDVATTGGHLIAAARFLRQHGHEVEHAFVVGRTAWTRPANMFTVTEEFLDTSDPFDFFN